MNSKQIKLVIGLGNPEPEYQWNRHNFGWLAVDNFAARNQLKWQQHKISHSLIAEYEFCEQQIMLVKPQTFMNRSGSAVMALKNFYKLSDSNIIVLYDDLAIDFGKIKLSFNRSGGGHNGLQSIIEQLNNKEFVRIRLGIGPQNGLAEDFVLKNFSAEEKTKLPEIIDTAYLALEAVITEGIEKAASKYN